MCILLSSTEHPDYPFILLSNRDEFFRRPTEPADFRDTEDGKVKILAPLDLARPEHGTWIGVGTDGKLAVLLNFREENYSESYSEISRGVIPLDYLKSGDISVDEWVKNLEKSISKERGVDPKDEYPLRKVGGFTLMYGNLALEPSGKISYLNILSNRGDRGKVHVPIDSDVALLDSNVGHKTTFGLSNSLYSNPWPKVNLGEELLLKAIKTSVVRRQNLKELVSSCFEVLLTDTLSQEMAKDSTQDFSAKMMELKKSIFIPPVELGFEIAIGSNPTIGRYYGTRTQTVIVLDKEGELHYFEKNLQTSDVLTEGEVEVKHFHFPISKNK